MKHKNRKGSSTLLAMAVAALMLVLAGACAPMSTGERTAVAGQTETDSSHGLVLQAEPEIGAAAVTPCQPYSQTVFLRAEPFIKTMDDGATVTMWGYAIDSKAGKRNGKLYSPGPQIVLNNCTEELIVRLENRLPVPTSLVINGLNKVMTPAYNADGRVRSLDTEVAPNDAAYFTWTNVQAGTYLYQSGTHMQVQVQMGLVGPMWKKYENSFAYPGKKYLRQLVMIYSEIDPDLHQAVATDNFGPGGTMTSTIDYNPKYFLLNGKEYLSGDSAILINPDAGDALFRLINAGLESRTVMFLHSRIQVIAEDARPYPFEQEAYSVLLEAGKTKDVLIRKEVKIQIVLDRSLGF